MKIKEFIEKGIEGNWRPEGFEKGQCTCFQNPPCSNCEDEEEHIFDFIGENIERFLLNPKLWEAVSKVEKWGEGEIALWRSERAKMTVPEFHMHNMVEVLFEGGTIESFIETL